MKHFHMIVATDLASGIGKDGDLPWRLSGDLKYFQKITVGDQDNGSQNAVIMGRKTWESLPEKFRPLPNRLNVVLTRNDTYPLPNTVQKNRSLEEALQVLEKDCAIKDIFIVGGGNLYKQAITHPSCQTIYRTLVDTSANCDTTFPKIPNTFSLTKTSPSQTENGLSYSFQTYLRSDT